MCLMGGAGTGAGVGRQTHRRLLFQQEEESLRSLQLTDSVDPSTGAEQHFTWHLTHLDTHNARLVTNLTYVLTQVIYISQLGNKLTCSTIKDNN